MSDSPNATTHSSRPVRAGFKVYSPQEYLAQNFPKPAFLDAAEYIRHPGRMLLWGAPGSYKTWWTLAKIVEVAARGARVFVCIGEGDESSVRERLCGVAKAQGIYFGDLQGRLFITHERVCLESPEGRAFLTQVVVPQGPSLVLFDPLFSYFGLDENKTADVKQLFFTLDDELLSRGISVVLVHHGRKTGKEIGSSPRGSSAFTGWADIELQLEAVRGYPGLFKVATTKRRDDRQIGDEEYVRWELREDIEGYGLRPLDAAETDRIRSELKTQRIRVTEPQDERRETKKTEIVKLLQTVGVEGLKAVDVRKTLGLSGASCKSLLDGLFAARVAQPVTRDQQTVWVLSSFAPPVN